MTKLVLQHQKPLVRELVFILLGRTEINTRWRVKRTRNSVLEWTQRSWNQWFPMNFSGRPR